jgi:hypothetical protein
VAQFASEIVQVNTAVGTVASIIWNPSNTSTTTLGALGSVNANSIFSGLIIANTGSNPIYVCGGSANPTLAGTIGFPVAANSQAYLSGYAGTVGTAGTIWAQTLVVGQTSSTQVGLPSVASVI